jgi:hypothetical protein
MHVKIKDPDKLVDRHILVWFATNLRLYSVFLATKCSRLAFNIRYLYEGKMVKFIQLIQRNTYVILL